MLLSLEFSPRHHKLLSFVLFGLCNLCFLGSSLLFCGYSRLFSLLFKNLLTFKVFPFHFLSPHLDFIRLLLSYALCLLNKRLLSCFPLSLLPLYLLLADRFFLCRLFGCQLILVLCRGTCLCDHLSLPFSDCPALCFLLTSFFLSLQLSFLSRLFPLLLFL